MRTDQTSGREHAAARPGDCGSAACWDALADCLIEAHALAEACDDALAIELVRTALIHAGRQIAALEREGTDGTKRLS